MRKFFNWLGDLVKPKTAAGKPWFNSVLSSRTRFGHIGPAAILLGTSLSLIDFATSRDPLSERAHRLGRDLFIYWLTLGIRNPLRQAVTSMGLLALPHMTGAGRFAVNSYREALSSRTMAAVPFSFSDGPSQQAYAALQYAQSRVSGYYSAVGSEAAFMRARLLSNR